jgi:hypothetical protein
LGWHLVVKPATDLGPDFFAPLKYPRNLWNQTVRQVSRVSIGGPRIRVVLSNEYGATPATIGDARVAFTDKGPAIVASSDRALTFGGRTTVTILPGAPVLSDPRTQVVTFLRQQLVTATD